MSLTIFAPLALLAGLLLYLSFDVLVGFLDWFTKSTGLVDDPVPEEIRTAAERGNVDAQITLGIFYAHGADPKSAQRWIQQSETTLSIRLRELAKRRDSLSRAA